MQLSSISFNSNEFAPTIQFFPMLTLLAIVELISINVCLSMNTFPASVTEGLIVTQSHNTEWCSIMAPVLIITPLLMIALYPTYVFGKSITPSSSTASSKIYEVSCMKLTRLKIVIF